MFFKKILVYLTGILNFFLLYFILRQPEKVWYFALAFFFLALITVNLLLDKKDKKTNLPAFFFLITILIFSSIIFLLILESLYLKILLVLFLAFFSIFYWRSILNYLYLPQKYHPFSLANFFTFASFLTVFFASSSLYAFNVFVNFSWWLIALILGLLILTLAYLNQWINKENLKEKTKSNLLLGLCFLEFSLFLVFLPISYYIKSFVFTLIYYFINFFLIPQINKKWPLKTILWLAAFAIFCLLLLIQTRWL